MLIEAIGKPLICRWTGGEVRLEPGKPVDLPEERAQRLLAKAPGKVRVCLSPMEPGLLVTWSRGDGSQPEGFVDFLHVDTDGKQWAFVSFGKTWAVVNAKFLSAADPAQPCSESAGVKSRVPEKIDGGPCFSCHSTRRWLSVHGAVVCGICHPPAAPGLVLRWIE